MRARDITRQRERERERERERVQRGTERQERERKERNGEKGSKIRSMSSSLNKQWGTENEARPGKKMMYHLGQTIKPSTTLTNTK